MHRRHVQKGDVFIHSGLSVNITAFANGLAKISTNTAVIYVTIEVLTQIGILEASLRIPILPKYYLSGVLLSCVVHTETTQLSKNLASSKMGTNEIM